MFKSKFFSYSLIFVLIVCLVGCGTPLSPNRTVDEQAKLKQKVMKLLEKEYKQKFKLESFRYEYKTHYPGGACNDCRVLDYGTFYFKVQAINNSIIILDFKIDDKNKDSIKDLIESFKKTQLKKEYCTTLSKIYMYQKQKNVDQDLLQKAKSYCDARGQSGYKDWSNLK